MVRHPKIMQTQEQTTTQNNFLADSSLSRNLSRLECSGFVREPKRGENIEYNTCEHDYTMCSNHHCIKKLV